MRHLRMPDNPDILSRMTGSELALLSDTAALTWSQRRRLAEFVASVARERVRPLTVAEHGRARELERQTQAAEAAA